MKPDAYERIPSHMMESMEAYVSRHVPVGDFLQSIIANDLKMAVLTADHINLPLIPIYSYWFYMEAAPARCQGSRDAYHAWIGDNKL